MAEQGRPSYVPTMRQTGIGLLITTAAVLSGLAAVTANAMVIGLMAGLIGGIFLLAAPKHAVTLTILLGLSAGVVLSHLGPAFGKLSWVVSLLGFFLLIPSLAHAGRLKSSPTFVYAALLFIVFAMGTTVLQWHSSGEVFAGIKRQIQLMGLLFALALIPFSTSDYILWRKLVVVLAALQLPFAIYEHLVLVPKLGGLEAGSASTDVVAGTFGANLESGSPNSVMALFLLVFFAYVLAQWKEGLIKFRQVVIWLVLCLGPIALGEVKIAFIMLPLVFFVVFKGELMRRPSLFLGALLLGAILFAALGYILLEYIIRKPLVDVIEDTLRYNLYERGYGRNSLLNRTTVLTFWLQQQGWHDPIGLFFGHGLGSSFITPSTYVVGHIATRWPMHGINLTSASTLLWDTGLFGIAAFMLVFALAWRACRQILKNTRDPQFVAEATAIQSAIALLAIFVFYNDALVSQYSMLTIYSIILGYLAVLWRRTSKTDQG